MAADISQSPRFIVLTGGPGAGKTAVLEVLRKHVSERVRILPEAAGVVFGGGFPRHQTDAGRRAAQRAIYHVERELETMAAEEGAAAVVLCDRGTLDGVAYWPGDDADYFRAVGTSLEAELARYSMVIHLQTPSEADGYNHHNPLRIESAVEAARIDARIAEVWSRHPKRIVIQNSRKFFEKLTHVLAVLHAELPADCMIADAH